MVNYAEQGTQDSGCDSDYEAKLKPQQPLDNKSYPSASRIATQHLIETNRASKQTSTPLHSHYQQQQNLNKGQSK